MGLLALTDPGFFVSPGGPGGLLALFRLAAWLRASPLSCVCVDVDLRPEALGHPRGAREEVQRLPAHHAPTTASGAVLRACSSVNDRSFVMKLIAADLELPGQIKIHREK